MIANAFTQSGSLSQAIIAFAQYARREGLNVGVQETIDALQAAALELLPDKTAFRYALKALFCCRQEDTLLFNRLFDRFWDTDPDDGPRSQRKVINQAQFVRRQSASLVMMGQGQNQAEDEEGKNVSGTNAVERLRRTDFSKVSEIDAELLEELAQRLWREMSLRMKRRMRSSTTKGRVDLRRTIRRSIGHGGDPIELIRKNKKPRKQRLVILLDVSGSMDKYSFFLLRFLCSLKEHFEQVEAFIFSTVLQRITGYLEAKGLAATLKLLSDNADSWSSGTKIGECLHAFNEMYAKRVLNGNSLVIILSDGLDTGEPDVLAGEMKKMALRTKKVVWLNPLKGMQGYEPTARGMSAALPSVDVFHSAHNLDSLLELENLLIDV